MINFDPRKEPNKIFTYGSNESGIHGAGAAKTAQQKYGAVYGKYGFNGNSYGIPTKSGSLHTLELHKIRFYVEQFLTFAKANGDLKFLLTPIGTGLAGIPASDIAPMFKNAPSNVILPDEFSDLL